MQPSTWYKWYVSFVIALLPIGLPVALLVELIQLYRKRPSIFWRY